MSDIDWTRRRGADELVCQIVSAQDKSTVLGTLPLVRGEGSMTQAYYSDTRVSASVTVSDMSGYVAGSWLRLVHQVRGTDYSRALGTFLVWDDPAQAFGRGGRATLELKSALYGLDTDVWPELWTVGAGASVRDAAKRLCGNANAPLRFDSTYSDATLSATRSYDDDQSILAALYDLADAAGARVDVDGDGTVALARYVVPSARSAGETLDATDPAGLVVAGSVQMLGTGRQTPTRYAVRWRDGDEKVTGWADRPSSDRRSAPRVGYTHTSVRDLTDMAEPRTRAHAAELAADDMAADETGVVSWSCETLWWEASAGDVVSFDPGPAAEALGVEAGARRCLVQNVESSFGAAWRHALTLKEV